MFFLKGKLIVIEGLDGCGKSTQLDLLHEKYSDKAKFISFPNYDSPSGSIVKDYLSGKFPEDDMMTGCFTASSFYAVDRYTSYKEFWENDYKNGTNIVAARYTTSNAIYQMAKLEKDKWDEYLEWLWDFEYNKFSIPKPDKVIFLDMPIEISQKLLSKRYDGDESKKDIHEKNIDFLIKCRETALYTAEYDAWQIVKCAIGENIRSIGEINEELSGIIESVIL
ncbi:MAG: deoxynucleoside kinase [Ruminiclostridium sp.]|nr:deoxynucleoside kinase [Ruminiclostridium sp.]